MKTTIICGFKQNKRAHYCDFTVTMDDETNAMMHFAEHSLSKHGGKMVGELIREPTVGPRQHKRVDPSHRVPINGVVN